jgi:hypothetical protein
MAIEIGFIGGVQHSPEGKNKMSRLRSFLLAMGMVILAAGSLCAQTKEIPLLEDQNDLEFIGQFNNAGATSEQFGYISRIEGLDDIFSGAPQNETTALFTFVTHATTIRVVINGPLRIVNRTGTTTIYLNNGPSDFSNPASFSQGTPIQVSTYRQQVVLNMVTLTFVTTHMNTITETHGFSINGVDYRLGHTKGTFRTSYFAVVNSLAPVNSGWFGGNAVGADKIVSK